ncbi:MAG: hypothetical protein PHP66_05130 [Syntrophales bacterium]|nr:hypothetical protein [Syntrophales bacterium]
MTESQPAAAEREPTGPFFKSRRELTGVARSIAHKFAFSLEHYAWLARHRGIPAVTMDLLQPQITPAPFDIERNRILANLCRQNLNELLKRLRPPAQVRSALLTAEFTLPDRLTDDSEDAMGRTTVTVVLTDEQGKEWAGTHVLERTLACE